MSGDLLPFPSREPEPVPERVPVEWLDDNDEVRAVPVDPPRGSSSLPERLAGPPHPDRQPVIPRWMRDRVSRRATVRRTVEALLYKTEWHVSRSGKYAYRVATRAPVGACRAVAALIRWWFDREAAPLRAAAVDKNDFAAYQPLQKHRDAAAVRRGWLVAAGLVTVTAAVAAVRLLVPAPGQWAALAALVGVLAHVGSPADKPLLDRAIVVARGQRLTSEVVVRALTVLGIDGMTAALKADPGAIKFIAPITRDGPGWRADIDLPYGITAAEVIGRRDKLASGLGRPLGCVWPETRHEISPSRLTLWVGDQDLASAKPNTWPLAKAGQVDLFREFPFGVDPRGRPVAMQFVETNLLIGSLPGAGKTAALRVVLLGAALDPRAELWVFELKGSGDLEAFEQVACRYGSGADDDTVEQALCALRDLRAECTRRAALIKKLPRDLCPDHKITPELAKRRGLHPLVVAIDECQELFSHKQYGAEAGELAEKVIKLGRALGVILLLATQRPDRDSLPTGISANVGTRFCLRVMGQVENDMVLGTSAYKNGVRATMFSKRDRGCGYLVGASDEPQIVRTYYVDGPAAHTVCARARAAREAAGTLEGHALGDEQTRAASYDLLADILAVLTAGELKVWSEELLERLAKLRPDVYGGWTVDQLALALKPYDVTTVQVNRRVDGRNLNRRGVVVADLQAARERRQIGR